MFSCNSGSQALVTEGPLYKVEVLGMLTAAEWPATDLSAEPASRGG